MSAKKSGKKTAKKLSAKKRDALPDATFAFPKQRKEPLVDAKHVRNALARFDQVDDVSEKDRDRAWKRIVIAAKRFDVEVSEGDWRELFSVTSTISSSKDTTKSEKATKVKGVEKSEKAPKSAPKKKSKKAPKDGTKAKKVKKVNEASPTTKKAKKIEREIGHG